MIDSFYEDFSQVRGSLRALNKISKSKLAALLSQSNSSGNPSKQDKYSSENILKLDDKWTMQNLEVSDSSKEEISNIKQFLMLTHPVFDINPPLPDGKRTLKKPSQLKMQMKILSNLQLSKVGLKLGRKGVKDILLGI